MKWIERVRSRASVVFGCVEWVVRRVRGLDVGFTRQSLHLAGRGRRSRCDRVRIGRFRAGDECRGRQSHRRRVVRGEPMQSHGRVNCAGASDHRTAAGRAARGAVTGPHGILRWRRGRPSRRRASSFSAGHQLCGADQQRILDCGTRSARSGRSDRSRNGCSLGLFAVVESENARFHRLPAHRVVAAS